MKKFLYFFSFVILSLCIFSHNLYAQSTANYTYSTTTTGSLENMSTGTTELVGPSQDDLTSAVTNIGFDFWFQGVRFSQFTVSSNGGMRLGPTALSNLSYGAAFPFASQSILAPFMGDFSTHSTGKVHYKVTGSAPNRVLVVEWLNMTFDWSSTSADATFQCFIYETTGKIEFRYGFMSCGVFTNAPTTSIGIASTTTANNYAMVDQDLMTNTTTVVTRKTYAATGEILTLSSLSDGSRRTITYEQTAPLAPTGLNFTAITGVGMTLNWTDNATDETGTAIYRSTDGGSTYSYITRTAANATSYAATNLNPGQSYTWLIYAVREGANSTSISGSQSTLNGTFSGTRTVGPGGEFATLTAALTQIKTDIIGGTTVLDLLPTYTSAGETFPLDFSLLGTTASNTLTIRPQTGATGLTITGSSTTAIMTFSSSYITIEGRPGGSGVSRELTVANTSTTGSVMRFINDGTNNAVRYCNVTGVTSSTTSGLILFSTSTGFSGNSFNTITNNSLRNGASNPSNLVYSSGTAAAPNSDNTVSNNIMFNFSGSAVNVGLTGNGNNWTVTANNIYNELSVATTQTAILLASPSVYTITNNIIGGSVLGGTGTWTNTGNVLFQGISMTSAGGLATITGNTICNMSGTTAGTTARTRGVNYAGSTIGAVISNNTIFNLSTMSTAVGYGGSAQPVVGISGAFGGFAAALINDNTIYNLTAANTFANATSNVACGIFATNFSGEISRNRIYDIKNKATGVTALQPPVADGIFVRFLFNAVVSNNMISVGSGENTNTQFGGIQMVNANTSTNEHAYLNNSIVVTGTSGGTWSSFGFVRGDNSATTFTHDPNLYNNLIVMERTGGGSVNYAVANQGSAPASNWTSDYNMLYCSDPNTVGLWGTTAYTFAGWKSIATPNDANSISPSSLNSANLFTDILTGNLLIQTANVEAWLSNGNGFPVPGVPVDYQGNPRSTTIAGGATDLGADEFTPSSTPPTTAFPVGGIGAIPLTINGRTIGTVDVLNIGSLADAPLTNLDVKYYSGVNPPNGGAFLFANAYWEITPNGGASGYSYNITLNYTDAQLGTIATEDSIRIAKSDNGGTSYTPFLEAGTGPNQYQINTAANSITVFGLTSFSIFALTDASNPLPVELASFTSTVNRNDVTLNWSTTMEENNSGFDIERKPVESQSWSKVANITGNGTTNETKNYSFNDRGLNTGKYNYRLKQIDYNGNFKYFNLSGEVIVGVPSEYQLSQNYPNPFNPVTKINYDLPFDSKVGIRVYDMLGREVAVLVNDQVKAGYYTVQLNAINMASGTYFFRIIAQGTNGKEFVMTKKMQLIK